MRGEIRVQGELIEVEDLSLFEDFTKTLKRNRVPCPIQRYPYGYKASRAKSPDEPDPGAHGVHPADVEI